MALSHPAFQIVTGVGVEVLLLGVSNQGALAVPGVCLEAVIPVLLGMFVGA